MTRFLIAVCVSTIAACGGESTADPGLPDAGTEIDGSGGSAGAMADGAADAGCGGWTNVCSCPSFSYACSQGFNTWLCSGTPGECGESCPSLPKTGEPCAGDQSCVELKGTACGVFLCACAADQRWKCGGGGCSDATCPVTYLPGDPCEASDPSCTYSSNGSFPSVTCQCNLTGDVSGKWSCNFDK